MKEKFEDELWKEYAEKCVLCGACNFVCPTCHCFTIKDDTNLRGTEGKRIRRWDSCHFKNFALIAGGLNFRGERNSRVKNRLYDKLCYSPQKYGVYSCVGCGRCIRSCPAKIDIREIAKKIRGGAE
jgi:Fe-S oxidoreductase